MMAEKHKDECGCMPTKWFLAIVGGLVAIAISVEGFHFVKDSDQDRKDENLTIRVSALEGREIPPEWFKTQVDKLESKVDKLNETIGLLRLELISLQKKIVNDN